MRFGNRDKATIVHAFESIREALKPMSGSPANLDMIRCRIGALSATRQRLPNRRFNETFEFQHAGVNFTGRRAGDDGGKIKRRSCPAEGRLRHRSDDERCPQRQFRSRCKR